MRWLLLLVGIAAAEPRPTNVTAAGPWQAQAQPRSGALDMSRELQAMQADDSANPGMLWVQEGEALFQRPEGRTGKACAACHAGLAGVAARYPAWDTVTAGPIDLAGRIQHCRTEHQQATPLPRESEPLLALSAYVAQQSRGVPLAPPDDPRLEPARARGEALFRQRRGQFNLSCAQCHEDRAGLRLGSALIPEGHANGYPQYRLEWQALGSLQRRLRNCMVGVRAAAPAYGAAEYTEIELFLARRGAGLPVEAPAVRP
jgi:sulfur-oxidizing protein SoxA